MFAAPTPVVQAQSEVMWSNVLVVATLAVVVVLTIRALLRARRNAR